MIVEVIKNATMKHNLQDLFKSGIFFWAYQIKVTAYNKQKKLNSTQAYVPRIERHILRPLDPL